MAATPEDAITADALTETLTRRVEELAADTDPMRRRDAFLMHAVLLRAERAEQACKMGAEAMTPILDFVNAHGYLEEDGDLLTWLKRRELLLEAFEILLTAQQGGATWDSEVVQGILAKLRILGIDHPAFRNAHGSVQA